MHRANPQIRRFRMPRCYALYHVKCCDRFSRSKVNPDHSIIMSTWHAFGRICMLSCALNHLTLVRTICKVRPDCEYKTQGSSSVCFEFGVCCILMKVGGEVVLAEAEESARLLRLHLFSGCSNRIAFHSTLRCYQVVHFQFWCQPGSRRCFSHAVLDNEHFGGAIDPLATSLLSVLIEFERQLLCIAASVLQTYVVQ